MNICREGERERGREGERERGREGDKNLLILRNVSTVTAFMSSWSVPSMQNKTGFGLSKKPNVEKEKEK
jgi:hypothetical protein